MSEEQYRIDSDSQYARARAILSRQTQPAAILRLLMRAMEAYRGARKMGWSRPWNKYGVVNHQSFRLRFPQDQHLLDLAQNLLDSDCVFMDTGAKAFVRSLLSDRDALIGFVFVHDVSEQGAKYEGATLSLGRIQQKRFRDRLDIVVESPVIAGLSRDLQRLRVFVDPYNSERKEPLWCTNLNAPFADATQQLFAQLADSSWQWAGDEERVWDHWTSRYIDYFGPRMWPMNKSYFYVPDKPDARLVAQRSVLNTQRNIANLCWEP